MQKEYKDFDWNALLAKLPVKKNKEEREKRRKLWRCIDANGNGVASLAELDRGIIDVLNLPQIFNVKKPILRAFVAAKNKYKSKRKCGEDYVEWMEFRIFLVYLRQYFEYWVMFCRIDENFDKKVSLQEFKEAVPLMAEWGVKIDNPEEEFRKIDTNNGGSVLFDEFCHYAISKELDLEDDDDFDDSELNNMK